MKKEIIAIAILVASGMFTACTDVSEDILQNKTQQELEMTGGEEDQDPDEDEDPDKEAKITNQIKTGGNDHDPDEEDEDEESKTLKMFDTGGEDEPTPVEDDEDN
ncbi:MULTISPECIES: hypothetical protein [unclassified Tenacibaculum]|uniref:hypothetical protein n=1 Tax=unclassified Tenacibaculum TaxID=2635139 RepID=UPI001F22A608|nr:MULTISPECIES: hypothetical protein [unclassified Tenacibaculum]MCF2875063.1 hypothetical protein [Tenacibaculum sp. Cn5-1]MCF2935139.1 hypothetical protein [Tenacibaculum sp. Cn5-34]MCG7511419.1 hypothetical protein [Tenacibaculum sp. Cn5-46]